MRLKRLVALQKETKGVLDKYRECFEVYETESGDELRKLWKSIKKNTVGGVINKNSDATNETDATLLIAATDDTICLGKELGIATVGYLNPGIQDQSLRGVEYVIEGFDEVESSFLEKVYQRYHHIPWTIAETNRCIIRELSLEDIDALFELYKDEELTRYTEPLFEFEEELEYQRAYINNMYRYFGYGMWLVFLKETGELIGRAGLEHREYHGETEVELGYLIGTKYQRKGFGLEVCQAIMEVAKEEYEITKLNCLIEEGNTPSIKLAETLGFSYEETFQQENRNMLRFVRK